MKRKRVSIRLEEEASKNKSIVQLLAPNREIQGEAFKKKMKKKSDEKFYLSRCQQQQKKKKANTLAPPLKEEEEEEEEELFNILNQNSNIFGWQQKKKRSKLGKSISNNTAERQMDNIVDQEAMGIHFQEEILMEILSRLPVRSLLRFACVSKFWNALIYNPYFKMKHLNHAKNDQNSQKLLVSQTLLDKDDIYTFCCSLSPVQPFEDVQKLDIASNCKRLVRKMFMFCCCDGLFLLEVMDGPDRNLLLWNPSTRESVTLARPQFPVNRYCTFGLGYDATSDDYKILKINRDMCGGLSTPYEIFTLKSSSWRKIGTNPTGIFAVMHSVVPLIDSLAFVHGAFHWVGMSQRYYVVSFSVSNEVYGEIPLPERICSISPQSFSDTSVSVLGGMLCFNSLLYNYRGKDTFKLWVMKEYGIKESWTELFTMRDTNLYCVRPKYRFANGEVLLCSRHLGPICSVFRTSRGPFELWPQRDDTFQEGFAYTESLIFPKLLA